MPAHTHMRRSEVYFYFDVEARQRVVHLDGPPDATSHLIMADKQVWLSGLVDPCRRGTKNYGFCWGMGGETRPTTTWTRLRFGI